MQLWILRRLKIPQLPEPMNKHQDDHSSSAKLAYNEKWGSSEAEDGHGEGDNENFDGYVDDSPTALKIKPAKECGGRDLG
jgi:hypothetical protein